MNSESESRRLVRAIDRHIALIEDARAKPGVGEIRDRIRQALAQDEVPVVRSAPPAVLAEFLQPALLAVAGAGEPDLADAIGAAAPFLDWITYDAYGRDRIGADFADGHAFSTLIGDGGPLPAEDFCLGLFLIAPHVLYRDHHHPAPELYVPLTGPHGWRFGPGGAFDWREAHQPVWNNPDEPHATLTGDVPFLCIFGWTRDVQLPARTIPSDDWAEIDFGLQARKSAARQ